MQHISQVSPYSPGQLKVFNNFKNFEGHSSYYKPFEFMQYASKVVTIDDRSLEHYNNGTIFLDLLNGNVNMQLPMKPIRC